MSSCRARRALCTLLLAAVPPASAQQRLFPSVASFELPQASPRVFGIAGRVLLVDRADSRFGAKPEGEVALGENFPILTLRGGRRPIVLGFGSQVYGRFSLADSRTALISNDWVVGVNATASLAAWDLTVELFHESSHLGDEYRERFAARRLDWTREVAAAWASWRRGVWRLTGSVSYVLLDELGLARPGGALAADYHGRPARLLGARVRAVGGVFLGAQAATDWRVSTSAKLGVAFGGLGRREVALALIAHDGLSTQRQFFRRESRYAGLEVRFDL
jgi:hypothetical protein